MFVSGQVRSHGKGKVTVSYKYIIQDALRSSLESNLLQEDAIFYEWALKMWSHCSRPCGGGTATANVNSRHCTMAHFSTWTIKDTSFSLNVELTVFQGNSIQGSAAGGKLMGKWFIECFAPTSVNLAQSAATATVRPAANRSKAQLTTVLSLVWFSFFSGL